MSGTVLVIGIGNEYRGDDAAGIILARRLGDHALPGVTVLEQSGEGAALMEAWKNAGEATVMLIDAVASGARPGTRFRFEAARRPIPTAFFHYSTHAFSVAEAIELARALGELPPRLIVYGIEGEHYSVGSPLSGAVQQALSTLEAEILGELKDSSCAEAPG